MLTLVSNEGGAVGGKLPTMSPKVVEREGVQIWGGRGGAPQLLCELLKSLCEDSCVRLRVLKKGGEMERMSFLLRLKRRDVRRAVGGCSLNPASIRGRGGGEGVYRGNFRS